MHYRSLGNTGVTVSEIGMGCNRLGEAQQPDSFWVTLVQHAVDLGVTLFDTCEAYNWGRSEDILGQAIGNRDDVLIADKISRVRETGRKRLFRRACDAARRAGPQTPQARPYRLFAATQPRLGAAPAI